MFKPILADPSKHVYVRGHISFWFKIVDAVGASCDGATSCGHEKKSLDVKVLE